MVPISDAAKFIGNKVVRQIKAVKATTALSPERAQDTPVQVQIFGGGGSGAKATASFGGNGRKINIYVKARGEGYLTEPTILVDYTVRQKDGSEKEFIQRCKPTMLNMETHRLEHDLKGRLGAHMTPLYVV